MSVSERKLDIPVFAAVFFITAGGCFVRSFFADGVFQLMRCFLFGTVWATVGLFIYHLFMARGVLKAKILLIAFLALFVISHLFLFYGLNLRSDSVIAIQTAVAVVLSSGALIISSRLDGAQGPVFRVLSSLPRKYRGAHPVKSFLETLFRLFPYPEPLGLYEIGDPGPEDMVIATGNYDLTIRRVAAAMAGRKYRLLVCDSRGINIWCSVLAGHFTTDSIIQAIIGTGLGDKCSKKILYLPQLGAPGLDIRRIAKETGFYCHFGPVEIRDLELYVKEPKNGSIRLVSFDLKARLEAAAGTLFIPAAILLLVFNFISLPPLVILLPALYVFSFINAAIFPHRFIRNIWFWAFFLALLGFGIIFLLSRFFDFNFLLYGITLPVMFFYLVNEFEGWSPLVKFNPFSSYTFVEVTVDKQKCTGCRMCLDVCPRGVFALQERKSVVVGERLCIFCQACRFQCPVEAITLVQR